MESKLYLECLSGISGDMMVAALIDLGADQEVLDKALQSLPVQGFQTKISRVIKSGLNVCDFAVILDSKHENHDHDMNYLHGEHHHHHDHIEAPDHKAAVHHHEHIDVQEHEAEHHHEHMNIQEHAAEHHHEHADTHEHRGLREILDIINQAEITDRAKALASRIFSIIAKAEAKVHGVDISEVHFHEVGAVDSIVDIIAVAVCIDNLGIEEVVVPALYDGTGFIRCRHGIIPVPVPAVVAIAEDTGLHLHITASEGEFVTPTGAAIAAALRTSDKLPEHFSIRKTGYGAGKRNYEGRTGFLRVMLIREES